MLKLNLQYFGHLMQRTNSLENTLMLGMIEGKRRRGQQKMRCLDSMTDSMDMNLSKLREIVKEREVWHAAVHGVTESWTQQFIGKTDAEAEAPILWLPDAKSQLIRKDPDAGKD